MTAVKQAVCSKPAIRRHQTTCRPDEFWTTVWRMWWRQTSGDGDWLQALTCTHLRHTTVCSHVATWTWVVRCYRHYAASATCSVCKGRWHWRALCLFTQLALGPSTAYGIVPASPVIRMLACTRGPGDVDSGKRGKCRKSLYANIYTLNLQFFLVKI